MARIDDARRLMPARQIDGLRRGVSLIVRSLLSMQRIVGAC